MSSRKRKNSRGKSAKSFVPVYLKKPSREFQKGKKTSQALSAFRDGIKLVRKLYSNFDASHGFDLRYIERWPASRIQTARRFMGEAQRLTRGEYHELYTLARPRNVAQRQALRLHTGLQSPDESHHPQHAWPIYANTRRVKVRYVPERVLIAAPMGRPIYEERLRAEIRRSVPGGILVHRDYLFREVLGFQPGLESTSPEGMRAGQRLGTFDPWEQMVLAMQLLVKVIPDRTPNGNEAHYRLISDRGPIGTSVPKHMLVDRMQTWGEDYNVRYAGLLLGVRYQGDEFKAIHGPQSLDKKAQDRRARYAELARLRRRGLDLKPVIKTARLKKSKPVKKSTRKKRKPSRKK